MAKVGEVTVSVKLDISKETAETCLRIVEMYVNSKGARIEGVRLEDGEQRFRFVENDLPER